jgi:hypothetical protein
VQYQTPTAAVSAGCHASGASSALHPRWDRAVAELNIGIHFQNFTRASPLTQEEEKDVPPPKQSLMTVCFRLGRFRHSAAFAFRASEGFELGFERRPICAVSSLFGAHFCIQRRAQSLDLAGNGEAEQWAAAGQSASFV